jgi:translation initiation factor IF-3
LINKVRLNQAITAPQVRLIGLNGEQVGVVSLSEALAQAEQAGYDLAEIAPKAQPPVVKILDWGKYQYELTKQLQKSRKNQKLVEVKQIRLGLKIGDHDFNVKLHNARKFLEQGHKVKVGVRFKGREITHPDLGHALLARFMSLVEDLGQQEQAPQLSGRELSMVIGTKKNAQDQNS